MSRLTSGLKRSHKSTLQETVNAWISGGHHSLSACVSACSHSESAGTESLPGRKSGERSTSCPAERACGFLFQAADFQLGVSTGESSTKRTLVRFLGAATPAKQGLGSRAACPADMRRGRLHGASHLPGERHVQQVLPDPCCCVDQSGQLMFLMYRLRVHKGWTSGAARSDGGRGRQVVQGGACVRAPHAAARPGAARPHRRGLPLVLQCSIPLGRLLPLPSA